jgi:multidrug efflux pump subunit AcrA (membrane-fusion protein)
MRIKKRNIVIPLLLLAFAISCTRSNDLNDGPRPAGATQTSRAMPRLEPRHGFGVRTAAISVRPLTHHVRAVAMVRPQPSQPRRLWITADVYAEDVGLVRVGQRAEVSMASAPRINFRSVVRYVSPTIDDNTRTAQVRIDPGRQAHLLKPGLVALVDLDSSLGKCLALPDGALIQTGRRNMVYVQVGESTFQPREVQLGRVADGFYEILGGLRPGDRVVTSQAFLHGAIRQVNAQGTDVVVR